MTDKKTNWLWNILKSLRLTLILLALLAAASIVGTLMGEDGTAIYHSLWFRFIIFSLALNLLICSIDRLPATMKRFRHAPAPDRSRAFEDAAPRAVSVTGPDVPGVSTSVQDALRGSFKDISVKDRDGASFIYCEKGRLSLFSVYVVHLSVLFILAGAMIGSIFGFTGYIELPEGTATDRIIVPEGDGYIYRDLGFIVRCEDFLVDYYDNGTPREYRSDLSFLADGQTPVSGTLRVNHPIKFMGMTFYQSTYGTVPGDKARIRVINNDGGVEETVLEIEKGKTVTLPDNMGELTLADINENLMNMMGPAVLINIKSPEGEETPIWLFLNRALIEKKFTGMFDLSRKFDSSAYSPFTFELDGIDSVPYTGLQVAKDPGVGLVFIGFTMIIIGLIMTFFLSHKRFWIRITDEKGHVRITIAGAANKNQVNMERELDRLLARLKVSTEGRSNG